MNSMNIESTSKVSPAKSKAIMTNSVLDGKMLCVMILFASLLSSLLTAGFTVGVFIVVYDEGKESSSTLVNQTESLERFDEIQASLERPVAPIGATTLGHGRNPDTLNRRRLQEDNISFGVLDLDPTFLSGMERVGITIPFDWECQTASSGGVYPCPSGISSECRWEDAGLNESCVACVCALTSNQPSCCEQLSPYSASQCPTIYQNDLEQENIVYGDADWIDSVNDTCKQYFENPSWCSSYGGIESVNAPRNNASEGCFQCKYGGIFDTYGEIGWVDSVGDTCESYFNNPSWCTTYGHVTSVRSPHTNASDACFICKYGSLYDASKLTCDANSLIDNAIWNARWWDDANVGPTPGMTDVVFVNFKITRYEVGDAFGVEFYSTEGDTVRIFPSGNVYFKPKDAGRDILLNEEVELPLDFEHDGERRRLTSLSNDPVFPRSETQIQRTRACMRSPNACEASVDHAGDKVDVHARETDFDATYGWYLKRKEAMNKRVLSQEDQAREDQDLGIHGRQLRRGSASPRQFYVRTFTSFFRRSSFFWSLSANTAGNA